MSRIYQKEELKPDCIVIRIRTDIKAYVLVDIVNQLYDFSLGGFILGDYNQNTGEYDEVWEDPIIKGFVIDPYEKDTLKFTIDFNRGQNLYYQACRVGHLFYRIDVPNIVISAYFCSQGIDHFIKAGYGIGTNICQYHKCRKGWDYDNSDSVPPANCHNKDRCFLDWALDITSDDTREFKE